MSHVKLKIEKETVLDWGLPWDDYPEKGIVILSDTIFDTGRWSNHHKLVVEINGELYITYYSVGATECQEERPWQYEDYVEFSPAKEIKITSWAEI